MTYVRILTACLLLPLCISACSQQNETLYIPDKKDQLSKRIEVVAVKRPVVILGQSVPTYGTGEDIANQDIIEDFQEYIANTNGKKSQFLKLRQELKLSPNQILLFGLRQSGSEIFTLADTELFDYGNILAVDHLRLLKSGTSLEKDPYETTAAYEQRVQTAQQKIKQQTAHLNIDLGLIEDALNFIHKAITIPSSFDSLNYVAYDADQQLLSIQTTVPFVDPKQSLNERDSFSVIHFQGPASAERAKSLIELWERDRTENPVYITFVLDYQPQGMSINRIVLLEKARDHSGYSIITEMKPKQIQIQKVDKDLKILQDQIIPLHTVIPYRFGFQSEAETQGESE